ncbi:Lrp/AsnC family transcriptional regulator [Alphaproteobacteria bacterium]|jgi:DNA-binding Lrp family transcriptional regulator|nr:Lrp/AsnC family transcriptional regulator [Alphaproteobacteria bacterium]
MSKLDKIDKTILSVLQEDARITNLDIAKKVGLSPSACLRRVTSLEKSGIIQSYNAEFDLSKLGHDVLVLVRITLQGQSAAMMSEFEEAAKQIPQILACFLIAGEEDYLLRIAAKDVTDFGKIHANYLSALPNVLRMESNFVLRPVFNRGLDANTF